jgi:hypothetical protein
MPNTAAEGDALIACAIKKNAEVQPRLASLFPSTPRL